MIKDKIQTDMITAMKAKDEFKTSCLRLILAQIKNKEIDKKADLDDQETVAVLRKVAKENNESITAFEKGGRTDLLEKAKKELGVVKSYLPPEISDEELTVEIKKLVETNRDLIVKSPKAIIGVCMKELKEKADGARIMKILSSIQKL